MRHLPSLRPFIIHVSGVGVSRSDGCPTRAGFNHDGLMKTPEPLWIYGREKFGRVHPKEALPSEIEGRRQWLTVSDLGGGVGFVEVGEGAHYDLKRAAEHWFAEPFSISR